MNIFFSPGTLGDLIIQSSIDFKKNGDYKFAVPTSLASAAKVLFQDANEVISLPDDIASGRGWELQDLNRDQGAAKALARLKQLYPNDHLISISPSRADFDRDPSDSLYAMYAEIANRHGLSIRAATNVIDSRSANARIKLLYIVPFGGIPLKNWSSLEIEMLIQGLAPAFQQVKVFATQYDPVDQLSSRIRDQYLVMPESKNFSEMLSVFKQADAVVSVDTSWYHLGWALGLPTLGISGPRSFSHFKHPSSHQKLTNYRELACLNCMTGYQCLINTAPICKARPNPNQVLGWAKDFFQNDKIVVSQTYGHQKHAAVSRQAANHSQGGGTIIRLYYIMQFVRIYMIEKILNSPIGQPLFHLVRWMKKKLKFWLKH
jgi:hypothetical protein